MSLSDGDYLHVKGRKYVLARFRHKSCGSEGWNEQLDKYAGDFWRAPGYSPAPEIKDCIAPFRQMNKPDSVVE